MDKYDENLADNKFLNCLKFQYDKVFEEAVAHQCLICIPKMSIVVEPTLTDILDHILVPPSEETSKHFTTRMSNEVILNNGSFSSNAYDKSVNILFEETFYDRKLGKYKVVCIDQYLTHLFSKTVIHSSDLEKEIRKIEIMKNLRSVNDFSDFIFEITQNESGIDEVDLYIAEFLAYPLPTLGHAESSHLRDKVKNIFDNSVQLFQDIICSLSDNEAKLFQISLESYIHHNVYRVVFEASTVDMSHHDEKLNRLLHSIKDINISNYDMKFSHFNWLISARYELAAINHFKSPFGKLQCIKKAIECFESDNVLSSDELLPFLVFCIVKCNISNWFANLYYIKTFFFCLKLNEEYKFILSSFEAGLEYLQSGPLHKVTAEDFKMELLNICNVTPSKSSQTSNLNSSAENMKNEIVATLHRYIKDNNLNAIKEILETRKLPGTIMNLNKLSESQLCHPLCTCCKCKNLIDQSRSHLLPNDIEMVDENKMTLLHVAALYGSTNIVEYLLTKEISLDSRNITGMTPLHFAAYKGYQSILLLLLHSGCDINIADQEGNTALHLASVAGNDKCIKTIVFFAESVGLPIGFDKQNLQGDTPLHIASRWGYSSTVKFLTSQAYVTVNCLRIRNNKNETPEECAHNATISSLLAENVLSEENHNINLLLVDFECQNRKNEDIYSRPDCKEFELETELLPQDVEMEKLLWKTLKAIEVGDDKLAYFYLEINNEIKFPADKVLCHPLCQCSKCSKLHHAVPVNCNLSLLNFIGENHCVLHAAVLAGNLDICRTLLCNGADLQIVTREERQSCLHLAVIVENFEIMDLLISFSINMNKKDIFGNTPLHLACIRGWRRGVCYLIECGAKMQQNNKEELSPKEEAHRNGHMDIVGVLIRKINET